MQIIYNNLKAAGLLLFVCTLSIPLYISIFILAEISSVSLTKLIILLYTLVNIFIYFFAARYFIVTTKISLLQGFLSSIGVLLLLVFSVFFCGKNSTPYLLIPFIPAYIYFGNTFKMPELAVQITCISITYLSITLGILTNKHCLGRGKKL